MADFKTHVTFSSVLGCGYTAAGVVAGMPLSTSLVAGGLCGVAGMLPDVDSDSGVPRREAMGFAAAIVPMLLLERFKQWELGHDQMVLAAAILYYFIRFICADLIGRWSVHRGMWHSIPAVLIFAGIAFLITGSTDLTVKYFKAFAVGLGAMSHLVLDEIYSVDTRGMVPKFKKSFGSAIKLFGKNSWANFSTYAKLAVVVALMLGDRGVLQRLQETNPELANGVQIAQERLRGLRSNLRGRFTGQPNQMQPNQPQPLRQPQTMQAPQPKYPAGPYPQQPQQQQPQQQPPANGFAPNNGQRPPQQYAPQQYPQQFQQRPTQQPAYGPPASYQQRPQQPSVQQQGASFAPSQGSYR